MLFLDPASYQKMAERILAGAGLGNRAYIRTPGYFYLLAFLEWLGKGSLWSPRIFQAFIDALSCGLVGIFAFQLSKRAWVGAISGLISACYWLGIYFPGELLITTSICFLNLLLIFCLSFSSLEKTRNLVLLGLLSALSAMLRPNILLFVLAVFLWWLVRKKYRQALVYLSVVWLGIMPALVRNLVVAKDPVLISSQAGINFWIGNNPGADGRSVVLPIKRRQVEAGFLKKMQDQLWFEETIWLVSVYLAEKETGRELKEGQVNHFWLKKTLGEIKSELFPWLKLFLKKIYYLIDKTEVSNNRDLKSHCQKIPLLRILEHFHLGWFLPLGIFGFLLCLFKPEFRYLNLYLIFYALSVVLFFVNSRYRMPLIYPLAIYSGLGAERLLGLIQERRKFFLGGGLAILGVLYFLSNYPLVQWNDASLRSALHYNLGLELAKKGQYEQAIKELKTVVQLKPDFPEAYLILANIYAGRREYQNARWYYSRALTLAPDYAVAHYNLGLCLLSLRKPAEAYDHLLQAHLLAPELFPAPEKVLEKLTR